jgi:hypothetical protein
LAAEDLLWLPSQPATAGRNSNIIALQHKYGGALREIYAAR